MKYETGEKLHDDELHNFCSTPNIIRMINLRMRWAGHLVYMGAKMNAKSFGGKIRRDH
jgi:hypothetical protein